MNAENIKTVQTNLPGRSRIWIYQADRMLTPDEVNKAETSGKEFISTWNAHGTALFADLFVLHNLFIILAVDEQVAAASGCSIDKSTRYMLGLQSELGVSLTNRLKIALWNGQVPELISLPALEEKLSAGGIAGDQKFFDGTVSSLDQLDTEWIKPLSASWLKKFLPEKASF